MAAKTWKKNQFGGGNQRNKVLEWNSYGIFFTCEYEKDGVREANNLISKYLDDHVPGQSAAGGGGDKADDEEGDISDLLKKAAEDASKPKAVRRIRQQPIGIKHCLFFTVAEIPRENIVDFVEKLVVDCQKEKQCRFLQRAIPVEDVSSEDQQMLKPKLHHIIAAQYEEYSKNPENEGKHATFAVDFKARFSEYKRQDALDIVCGVIEEIDPESKVNLSDPTFTVIFHVMKRAVLLSCAKAFVQRKKFSLSPPEEKEKDEAVKSESQEKADA